MPRTKPRSSTRDLPDESASVADSSTAAQEAAENSARLTFFLRETDYRALRMQVACFKVSSARVDEDDQPLPLTPSALLREVVQFWLEHFPAVTEAPRMQAADRARRMKRMTDAVKQLKQ